MNISNISHLCGAAASKILTKFIRRNLSALYQLNQAGQWEFREHKLELEVLMLNINTGHNSELMVSCHALWEYAEYTGRVRNYAKELPIEAAVERAVTECIREGILKSFLQKNRAEILEEDEGEIQKLVEELETEKQ